MQAQKLADIRPFEICSIRPPTKNHSLTFRLVRICYWKKCGFCPLYKTGAKFRKRTVEELRSDIENAGLVNELLTEEVLAGSPDFEVQAYAVILLCGKDTYTQPNLDSILERGLQKMGRHQVHLSRDVDTAFKVGKRHGKPVILEIEAGRMAHEGFIFLFPTMMSGWWKWSRQGFSSK